MKPSERRYQLTATLLQLPAPLILDEVVAGCGIARTRVRTALGDKVRELVDVLGRLLPEACEFDYRPRGFAVLYRGVRCLSPAAS